MAVQLARGKIRVILASLLQNPLDLSTPSDEISKVFEQAFTNGTGAGQANMVWSDTRTLTTGASESLDLAGSLTSAFGATITFTAIKAIIIRAKTTNTTDLTVRRHATTGVPFIGHTIVDDDTAEASLTLKPGAIFLLTDPSAAGITVTATTGDLITIVNGSGASADYDIVLIGEV